MRFLEREMQDNISLHSFPHIRYGNGRSSKRTILSGARGNVYFCMSCNDVFNHKIKREEKSLSIRIIQNPVAVCCERNDEPKDSISGCEGLDCLLDKNSADMQNGFNRMLILKWSINKQLVTKNCTFEKEYNPMAGVCLHGSENSALMKDGVFFGQLRNNRLLKLYSTPWN